MKFLKKIRGRFSARGRALAQVDRGMACANRNQSDEAIKYYTQVIDSTESPRDVIAMAIFNRALVYTTIGMERQATEDLKALLQMPEKLTKIKKSATDKLVRMQRKLAREESRNDG
jgi:tetratricopeptide (TPR) repeat protein